MDDVTASIIINCVTGGAEAAISKLGFNFAMLAKKGVEVGLSFAQSCLSSFNQAQDIAWKFGKTFRNTLGTATKAVESFSSEYNLATATAQNMLTSTASLLKGFGFSEKDALTMSEQVSRMGVDLASFTGVAGGAEEAVRSIVAAMTGNTRLMQKYGTLIHTNSSEFRELQKSIMETKGATEDQAKAMAVFETVMKRNQDAIGDYKAEGENWTQSQNNLKESFRELQDTIGGMLYQILGLNSATQSSDNILKTVTDFLKKNGPEITYWGKTVMNVVYTICDVVWQRLYTLVSNAIKQIKFFIESAQAIIQDFPGFMQAVWEDIKLTADNLWNYLVTDIQSSFETGVKIISSFIFHFKDIFADIVEIGKATFKAVLNTIRESITQSIKMIGLLGKSFWNLITGQESPSEILENIKNQFVGGMKAVGNAAANPFKDLKLTGGLEAFLTESGGAIAEHMGKMKGAWDKLQGDLGKNVKAFLASHGVEIPELEGIPEIFEKIKGAIERGKARQALIDADRGKVPEAPKDKNAPGNQPGTVAEGNGNGEIPKVELKTLGDFSIAKLSQALGAINGNDPRNPQKTTADNSKKQTSLLSSVNKQINQIIQKMDNNSGSSGLAYT